MGKKFDRSFRNFFRIDPNDEDSGVEALLGGLAGGAGKGIEASMSAKRAEELRQRKIREDQAEAEQGRVRDRHADITEQMRKDAAAITERDEKRKHEDDKDKRNIVQKQIAAGYVIDDGTLQNVHPESPRSVIGDVKLVKPLNKSEIDILEIAQLERDKKREVDNLDPEIRKDELAEIKSLQANKKAELANHLVLKPNDILFKNVSKVSQARINKWDKRINEIEGITEETEVSDQGEVLPKKSGFEKAVAAFSEVSTPVTNALTGVAKSGFKAVKGAVQNRLGGNQPAQPAPEQPAQSPNAAFEWAQSNPDDPRAKQILEILGQ